MKFVSNMKQLFSHSTLVFLSFVFLLASSISFAAENEINIVRDIVRDDPEKMLKQTTDALLSVSQKAKAYVTQDKARYYREVDSILNQVLDKEYFSRGVMATYASARQYNALKTEQEKNAFRQRASEFAEVMQKALIEKYADTLLIFNGERIDFEGAIKNSSDGSKVNIKQIIYDKDNTAYVVQYNLQKDKQGKWLVYNVIVEGVNMGSTYRNQFAEAVEKNKGDVDYVVSHWANILSPGAKAP